MKSNIIFAAALALAPLFGTMAIAQMQQQGGEERSDAQAMQAIHAEWAELIAEKDSAAIGALYAGAPADGAGRGRRGRRGRH